MRKPIHYLARILHQSDNIATIRRFDGDALLAQLATSRCDVGLYLFETCPSARTVGETLARNSASGIYSLFVLRGEWFIADEAPCHFESTLTMLRFLYPHKRVYAYQLVDDELWVLPVYEGGTYGMPVALTEIHTHMVEVGHTRWGIAEFGIRVAWRPREAGETWSHYHQYRRHHNATPPPYVAQVYYDVLGVRRDMREDEVRRAYRQLAQRYHPDLNDSPEATTKMQMINEAYRQIMRK